MATATGEYVLNFAAESNENPWVDANFTLISSGQGQILSGVLTDVSFNTALYAYTGGTYDGGDVTSKAEVNVVDSAGDYVLIGALDSSNYGYLAVIRSNAVYVRYHGDGGVGYPGGTIQVGNATGLSFTTDDVYAITVTKGSPNSIAVTRNGTPITLSASTHTATLGSLRAVVGYEANNSGTVAIKSFAVDGLSGGGAAPTITDAGDESYAAGETGITITGTNFGASQGTGTVKISPTDNVADSNAVTQTVTSWGDTSITFTCVRGTLALNTNLYLFVTSDGAYSNASGHVVQIAGTRKLKLLIEAAAVGATVDGIVWAKAAGQIAGAEIGEFTGATIAAGTGADSGYAVLKVPVADFGGGALNVNDTVLCYVKNATNFSAPWDATIIEE